MGEQVKINLEFATGITDVILEVLIFTININIYINTGTNIPILSQSSFFPTMSVQV